MIGLDTSILVRYLTQDDPKQANLATVLFEQRLSAETPGFVSLVALVELIWVLEGGYGCDRPTIVSVLDRLLRAKPLVIERADVASQAASLYAAGKADFADCLIERTGHANACDHTLTFDRLAAKHAGMRLLER